MTLGQGHRTIQSTRVTKHQRTMQGILIGSAIAVILSLILVSNLFASTRLGLSNIFFIPSETSGNIVIVALDNFSLSRYGRTPSEWSRTVYGEFLDAITSAEPRVIAFDLLFTESVPEDKAFAEAIARTRQSEARPRVILAASAQSPGQKPGLLSAYPRAIQFDEPILLPSLQLANAANGIGFVNTFPDVDSTIRRQPSILEIEGEIQLTFSLATYLAYLRIPPTAYPEILTVDGDTLFVTPERSLPVDDIGFWQQNFFGTPFNPATNTMTFPMISFADVVDGDFEPSLIQDKIVLVGLMNSTGATDLFPIPLSQSGEFMAGVEIQANAIETIIQNNPITTQPIFAQIGMIFVLAIGSSVLYSHIRWYIALVACGLMVVMMMVAAFVYFGLSNQIVNVFHSIPAIVLPMVIIGGTTIAREISRRRTTQTLLKSVVLLSEQQLRLDRILPQIAKDIQKIVPNSNGSIWLRDSQGTDLQLQYQWSGDQRKPKPAIDSTTLLQQTLKNQTITSEGDIQSIPFVWQNRSIGTLLLQPTNGKGIPPTTLPLLHDLTNRLAPGLENALLHSEIDRQKDVLEAILAGSPTGILVMNEEKQLIRSNEMFEQSVAVEPSTIIGKQSLFDLFGKLGMKAETRLKLDGLFQKDTPFREEIRFGARTFHLDAAPLQMSDQWVLVLNDVTNLIELNRIKTRMIRMASHDLKNPLSRVLAYSRLIREGVANINTEHRQFLDYVVQSGEEMKSIIDDILNQEQLRSQEMVIETLDMKAIVEMVITQHRPDALRKQQQLQFDAQDGGGIHIAGDQRHITQMVANLISNAIKYTPEAGQIHVRLQQENDTVKLAVQDTGYGIPADVQDKLFTEFFRVRNRTTVGIPGTGLGLSLVKWVVDAHHGNIWFESEEHAGSTFYVSLPIAPQSPASPTLHH